MRRLVLRMIRLYQATVSRVTSPACRYLPTCSEYAHEAIDKYGLVKGGSLTVKRLCRCHPLSAGGYDPVP
ncbi:MAG: membrane protein insertion efficiency factor YidD [Chloroflexota bacterium]